MALALGASILLLVGGLGGAFIAWHFLRPLLVLKDLAQAAFAAYLTFHNLRSLRAVNKTAA